MWPFLVAAGISELGSILKGSAENAAGQAARSTAQRNADLIGQAAADAIHRSQITEMREQAKGNEIIAEQRTAEAASGTDVNVGSNADIAQQTMQFTDLDREIIRNDALREAYGLRTKEQQVRQEGEYAAQAGRNSMLGSFIGGIGQVAGIIGPRLVDHA